MDVDTTRFPAYAEGETFTMNVTLDIPQEIEARLAADARARGVELADYLRDVVIEYYEDAQDRDVADSRLNDPQPPISSSQLRTNLGLES